MWPIILYSLRYGITVSVVVSVEADENPHLHLLYLGLLTAEVLMARVLRPRAV